MKTNKSGHIADVGFDLYVRLVGEALAHARGEDEPVREVRIEIPVDAHIPHDYIVEERLRLEAYRRLASAQTYADVDGVYEELLDRYGPLPVPVASLLEVARFRVRVGDAGLDEVALTGNQVRFHPVEIPESRMMRVTRLYPGTTVKPAVRTILVPRPVASTADSAGRSTRTPDGLRDLALLAWAAEVVGVIDPTSESGRVS